MREMITRNLTLKRLGEMANVTLMPHTTVRAFREQTVDIEKDGVGVALQPFETVIVASGMVSAPGPSEDIRGFAAHIESIGDAREVQDVYSATKAGYELAAAYC
jgi:hypothetical protein